MSKNIIYKIIVEEKKKTNYDWKELYIIKYNFQFVLI